MGESDVENWQRNFTVLALTLSYGIGISVYLFTPYASWHSSYCSVRNRAAFDSRKLAHKPLCSIAMMDVAAMDGIG
jgi:hypothetical protein